MVKVSKIEPLVLIAEISINLSIGGTITPFLSLNLLRSFSPAPPEIICGMLECGIILLE